MSELEEPYGRLPGLDIMLHPQINAHKESLPFLMSKKWEAVHMRRSGFLRLAVLFGVLGNATKSQLYRFTGLNHQLATMAPIA